MGIVGLLPFLSNIQKKVHISKYSGSCVAVDTSCWLHRGAFSCAFELATGQSTTKYVNYIVKRINLLLYHKIFPVMVFDGCNTPSKKCTNEKRREVRQSNREKGRRLLEEGNKSGAVDMFQKSISITTEMVQQVIKECVSMNVPVIVAPYEADAQLTYLVNTGIADFAITEDSDLLPFGCKKVLFKVDETGNAFEIDLGDLGRTTEEPRFDGWTIDKFRQMCIMSGCDYLERLPKCGLKTVHKQFRKFTNVDRGIRNFISSHNVKKANNIDPRDYYDKFLEAEKAFKYHLIFDPETGTIQPLHPLPPHLDLGDLPFLGEVFDPERAVQQASGNIDTQTGSKINTFTPSHRSVVKACNRWRESKGDITAFAFSRGQSRVKSDEWTNQTKSSSTLPSSKSSSTLSSSLSSWCPTTKPISTSSNVKRPATVPEVSKIPIGSEDVIVKMYGSGKRRKIIPNTTTQKSRFFSTNAAGEQTDVARSRCSETDKVKDSDDPYHGHGGVEVPPNSLSISEVETGPSLGDIPHESGSKIANPFRKTSAPSAVNDQHVKENIPSNTSARQERKFESSLSRRSASHILTSHSSAISYEMTLSQTVTEKLGEMDTHKCENPVTRIPSPIKPKPVTCGLSRSSTTSSGRGGNHGNQGGHVKESSSSLNKWISTQKPQNSAATRTKPVGLPRKNKGDKTQRTLNMFVKSEEGMTSKYFK